MPDRFFANHLQGSHAFLRIVRAWLLLLMAYALVGCTTTLSARVTSFQKWPQGVVGQTYSLEPGPDQSNNLKYQTYADMIRAAIGPTGLVEAKAGDKARFNVTFSYGAVQDHEWVQRFADPYFPGPRWGYYGWGPWGGGAFYPPPVVNVPVSVYKNTLTVSITDSKQDGAQVYQSSAVCATSGDSLTQVMPYLARAVFDHFPGNNGQVRIVRYDITGQ